MKKYPKIYGTVTVGTKGQIVIPSETRRSLKIKPGDKLIVFSGPSHAKGKIFSVIPADEFVQFLSRIQEHISTLKAEVSKKDGKNV